MANDHYVPQFYLRNFEIKNPSHPIQPNHVYSYKRGLIPQARAIKGLACEVDFDTVNEGGKTESTDTYNKLLKVSEDSAPPIIAKIVDSSTLAVSDDEIEVLAWFIALLTIRTPTAHRYFENDILRFQDKVQKPRIQKDCRENKEEIYRILRLDQPDIPDEQVEGVVQVLLNDEIGWEMPQNDNNKVYLRQTGNAYLFSLVHQLMSKNWHLLVAQNGSSFVTSDNPVLFLAPRPILTGNGFAFDTPVFLPLSPKVGLYIHQYGFCNDTLAINSKCVEYFVSETLANAEHFLFSDKKSEELQKRFNETSFRLSNLNFRYNFIPYEEMKGSTIAAWKHFANTRND